jgi:molybdopterin-biosynthesis enzyme MoeA-like protein
LMLSFVEYLGDNRALAVAAYQRSFALAMREDWCIFSCGGIGATPDDHTRQAAAAALGTELKLHAEAEALIRLRSQEMGQEATPGRLAMGEFPVGAHIIPNPYNRIPGFAINHHWFVPGFPVMAWPMIEWVLDTHYAAHFKQTALIEQSCYVFGIGESTLIEAMRAVEEKHGVKSFSLPSVGQGKDPAHIELGAKGEAQAVEVALKELRAAALALGAEVRDAL